MIAMRIKSGIYRFSTLKRPAAVFLVLFIYFFPTIAKCNSLSTITIDFLDKSPLPMILVDPKNQHIIEANTAAASFYKWSVETLEDMSITDINLMTKEQIKNEIARFQPGVA